METFFFGSVRALNLLSFCLVNILKIFLLLTVSWQVNAAVPVVVGTCEAQMGTRGQLAARVLRLALKLGELTGKQLEEFADATEWFDPFVRQAREPGNLALRNSFARVTAGMSAGERDLVRSVARDLGLADRAEQSQVADAREQTRLILNYKTERELLDKKHKHSWNYLGLDMVQGRPVFAMKVAHDNPSQEFRIYAFDPFHPDSNMRLRQINAKTELSIEFQPAFYAVDGKVHVALLGHGITFGLEGSTYGDIPAFSKVFRNTHQIVQKDGAKAIVYVRDGNFQIFDLEKPEQEPKKIPVNLQNCSLERQVRTASGLYIVCEGSGFVALFDVDQEKIVAEIYMGATTTAPLSDTVFYEDNGRKFLIAKSYKKEDPKIRIYDFADGTYRTIDGDFNPMLSSHLGVVNVKGVPHLYHFADDERLLVHNLRTLTRTELGDLKIRQVGESNSHYAVKWKGQSFLFFKDLDDNLQIYNFDSGMIEAKFPLNGKVIPFVHNDMIYAIFADQAGGVALELLTIEEDK